METVVAVGWISLALSLALVIGLTARDHAMLGWPTTAVACGAWLVAPVLARAGMEAVDLLGPLFNYLLVMANLSVVGLTRGHPVLMMDQLFDADDAAYTPELRRRGFRAQMGYVAIGLVAATIYTIVT